jgi:hypothetical protein
MNGDDAARYRVELFKLDEEQKNVDPPDRDLDRRLCRIRKMVDCRFNKKNKSKSFYN